MTQAQPGLVTYTLSVTVLEDLHHGAGLGGGLIDALFSRDRLGQPTIRWNHLKGLLRDALYERQNALDQPIKETNALANRLFGHDAPSPAGTDRSGLVSGTSIYCQPTEAVDSVVWTSASREVGKRSPAPETMRQIEFIPAQTKFKSELQFLPLAAKSLPEHGPTPIGVEQWLEKLLSRVNRLGAQKSRGAGLICISSMKHNPEQAKQTNPATAPAALSPHTTYRLLLENLDPVCLPTTGIPGNIIGTETYVPARTLHGALVRYLLAHGHKEAANAMLNHEHQLSNAYPVGLSADLATEKFETLAAMPRPLGLHKTKPNPQQGELPYWLEAPAAGTVHDSLGEVPPKLNSEDEEQPKVKTKRPGDHDYLYTQDGTSWIAFTQQTRLRLRNNAGQVLRDRRAQALYSTEEIPERTCFVTTLVLPTDTNHAQAIANALHKLEQGHWLLLGRGGTPVRLVKLYELVRTTPVSLNAAAASTLLATTAATTAATGFSFRLVLLSDTLVRDSNFAHHRSLSLSALRDMLTTAAPNQLCLPDDVQVKAASDVIEVHGYNFATRLPRMQATALRRGSELRMTGSGAGKWYEALLALKTSGAGLGERCFEGYGQFELFTTPLKLALQAEAPTHQFIENSLEVNLVKVDNVCTGENVKALLEAFTVTRWQALRNAARADSDDNKKTAVEIWKVQAEREAARKSAKTKVPNIDEFLKLFDVQTNGGNALNWPALKLFAERAAKQVQRQNIDKRNVT